MALSTLLHPSTTVQVIEEVKKALQYAAQKHSGDVLVGNSIPDLLTFITYLKVDRIALELFG